MADLTNIVFAALFLICWFFIIKRFIYSKYAPSKTVKAEVFDKYSRIPVSKYPGVFNQAEYIVVFKTKDKKISLSMKALLDIMEKTETEEEETEYLSGEEATTGMASLLAGIKLD